MVDGVNEVAPPGFVHLFVTLWDCPDPARREELLVCLRRNREDPSIAGIHVFLEGDGASWGGELPAPRCTIVPLQEYPSFQFLFEYAARHLPGKIVAIANSDIHFDASLALLRDVDLTGRLIALTRYNAGPYLGWNGRAWERNPLSQDVWIFKAPVGGIETEAKLGWFGCDGLLARDLQRCGIRVWNPSADIHAWHVHARREQVPSQSEHPKTHLRDLVESERHRHFRTLPIEPLGRWKLYTVHDEANEAVFQRWGAGTLRDDFDVVARRIPAGFPSADPPAWTSPAVSAAKVTLVLEALDAHPEGAFFVVADEPVEWFGPVEGRIRRLLAEDPWSDIYLLGRHDPEADPDATGVSTGVIVSKSNVRTRAFWTLVAEVVAREGIDDALAVRRILGGRIVRTLRVGTLPPEFWDSGMATAPAGAASSIDPPDPPRDMLVHHAGRHGGPEASQRRLERVREIVRRRASDRARSGQPSPAAPDHWMLTEGAIPVDRTVFPPRTPTGAPLDSIGLVIQRPERLVGPYWGVIPLESPLEPADAEAVGVIVEAARGMGMRVMVAAPRGIDLVAHERMADAVLEVDAVDGRGPVDRTALLAGALRALPPECDRVIWLPLGAPLGHAPWHDHIPALLERYDFLPLRADAVVPAAADGNLERWFSVVRWGFSPRNLRAALDASSPTAASWAARRSTLEMHGFASASPAS